MPDVAPPVTAAPTASGAGNASATVGEALARIAAAVLLPWIILAVLMPHLPAPALPLSGASLAVAIVLFMGISLAVLGYEILVYRHVARPIVNSRPDADLDRFDHDRLILGVSAGDASDAARMHAALVETIGGLVDDEGRLRGDIKSSKDVLDAVVANSKLAWLDRDALFGRLTRAVDHAQSRIDGEYSTIAARVGWVLASQAFLLAAFVSVVNAESMAAVAQQPLAIAMAFTGSVIAFVLLLGSMFAHALVDELKKARDDLEQRLHKHFGIRRYGVPVRSTFHQLGHSATRYVPCLTYLAWVALTIGTLLVPFNVAPPRLPSYVIGPIDLSQGWVRFPDDSPPFASGQHQYPVGTQGERSATSYVPCPDRSGAQKWAATVVAAWLSRHSPTADDALLLVGGADRTQLARDLRRQIDSNMALARERAETILGLLIDATRSEQPIHRITAERVLVTVTGPRIGDPGAGQTKHLDGCGDSDLAKDRTVAVWLPGPLKATKH